MTDVVRNVVSAPVVASSEASPPRGVPPIEVKLPPTISREPSRRTDITPLVIEPGAKAVTREPLLTLSRTRFGTLTPFMVVKSPPTYTVPAIGPVSRVSTSPLKLGAKVVLTAPEVASKAKMRLRLYVVVCAKFCTWLKVPPATIVLPTWAKFSTSPSTTAGVPVAGTAETIWFCGVVGPPAAHEEPAPVVTMGTAIAGIITVSARTMRRAMFTVHLCVQVPRGVATERS